MPGTLIWHRKVTDNASAVWVHFDEPPWRSRVSISRPHGHPKRPAMKFQRVALS